MRTVNAKRRRPQLPAPLRPKQKGAAEDEANAMPPPRVPFRMNRRMLELENARDADVRLVPLDERDLQAARAVHRQDPMARACQRTIMEPLFDMLPEFRRGSAQQPLQPSARFRMLIAEYWVPFMREAMHSIWTVGVVPVAFRPIGADGRNDLVPVVPCIDYGQLVMRYDNATDQRSYVFVRGSGEGTGSQRTEVDATVLVLDGFGADPTPAGRLTSVAAVLAKEAQFMSVMRRGAMRAERARTDPAVIVERPARTSAAGPDDEDPLAFSNLYYTQDDDTDAYRAQREKRRTEAQREQQQARREYAQRQRERIRAMRAQASGVVELARTPDAVGADGVADYEDDDDEGFAELPNFFDLPAGDKLAGSRTMPEARADYLELFRHYQDGTCIAYGVSRSRLTAEGTKVKGDAEGTDETHKRTMLEWRRALGRLLTLVYNILYASEEADAVLRARMGEFTEPMTLEEAFAAGVENRVTVTIPFVPTETSEELTRKYASNLISWDEYWTYSRRAASLPADEHARATAKKEEQSGTGGGAWPVLVRSSIAAQMNSKVYQETPWSLQIAQAAAQAQQQEMQLSVAKVTSKTKKEEAEARAELATQAATTPTSTKKK